MIKKITLISLLIIAVNIAGYSQAVSCTGSASKGKKENAACVKWKTNPFDHQVFIVNNGQFDGNIPGSEKILYAAQLGDIWAYFTSKGIVYRYTDFTKTKDTPEEEADKDALAPVIHYLDGNWAGASSSVTIEASDEQSYYYTYGENDNSTIRASIFKKIIYRNIYPGIDIEYVFPKGKDGLEYSVIVHPGADISAVKLSYEGAGRLNLKDGEITFNSAMGKFTDHAPVSYYSGETGGVAVSYKVNGGIESFSISKEYDKSKTLVIDPWTTNPAFTNVDRAYDLDWDYKGNVYAMGGNEALFQLVKMDNTGAIKWTYNATAVSGTGTFNYGGFCINRNTGTSFLMDGQANGKVLKVNNTGSLVSTYAVPASYDPELWRIKYDARHSTLIIGAGDGLEGATLDTNLATFTPIRVLGVNECCHDVCLMAMDPNEGQCYMAFSTSQAATASIANNVFIKAPLPSLSPTAYISADDRLGFLEVGSVNYLNGFATPLVPNAMNGAAASPNWLYLYDGDTLKSFNKNTGVFNTQHSFRAVKHKKNTRFIFYGGLDVDPCDNLFVGVADNLYILNSSYAVNTIIQLPDTVFDVKLGDGNALYACGIGFVTQLVNPIPPPTYTLTVSDTPASSCTCNGSATATITTTCDIDPFSYHWNNGATTQTATGLCAGTYKVITTDSSIYPFRLDSATITITQPVSNIIITTNSSPANCSNTSGSATATSVTGGATPYTYSWSPGGQTNSTSTGLSAGTYTVTVTDKNNCMATSSATITAPPGIRDSVSSVVNTMCGVATGSATAGVKDGTSPYTYLWSPGGQTNATATGLGIGTYTITATDNNGCSQTASGTVSQSNSITVNVSGIDVGCSGGNDGTATANPNGGASPYTYSWSPGGQTNVAATGLIAGNYTVTVTDNNGCSQTASVAVAQPNSITVTASGTNAGCSGGNDGTATANPNGGTSPYTYSWSAGGQTNTTATGLGAGTYTITVTDNNGCSQTTSVTVAQATSISVTASGTNIGCAGGDNGTAMATLNGGTSPYTYSWSAGGQTNATATGLGAGTYTITITDASGCSGIATAIITDQSIQALIAFSSDVSQGCSPLCIQFNNKTPVNTGSISYLWTFGNGDTSHAQNPVYCYSSGGVYSVGLTLTIAAGGCSATLNKINMIKVFSPPDAAFSVSPQPITIISPTIQFTDKSADHYQIIQWWWTFGDQSDSVSTEQNPEHTYQDTGTYCATLIATDVNGCADTATNCLVIDPLFTLYIPDAFSPNDDGVNDVFMAKGHYVKSFEMYIFDRWGEELFHSNGINDGWNGTVKGGSTVCQEDIYVYKILATDYENNQHSYIGNISLIK